MAKLAEHFQVVGLQGDQWYVNPVAKGKWSPAEFHEHLMLAESASMAYVKIKISYPDNLKRVTLKEKVKAQKLKLWLKSTKKAEAPEAVVPKRIYSSPAEVQELWIKQREALKTMIMEMPEGLLYTNIYKHPFVGKIGLHHMLHFYGWHFDRHHKQMRL